MTDNNKISLKAHRYAKFNEILHQLCEEGTDIGPEGNEIADGLFELWYELTSTERQYIRTVGNARTAAEQKENAKLK